MSKHSQVSDFSLEGRFLGFVIEDGYKLKSIKLGTADGEQSLKLSKDLRARLKWNLTPGDWFEVVGERKLDLKTGNVKLKVYRIIPIAPKHLETAKPVTEVAHKAIAPNKPKTTILMCQKSDCMKRGGKAVCQAMAENLRDRGLDDQVTVKGTGCMKQCKSGPHLVMPDKTRYSRIDAKDVPAIIDKHFPAQETVSEPEKKRILV